MNQRLLSEFTMEEVSQALNQMAPNKASGPDGFSADFFQQNWETVQLEVCNAALHFFNTGQLDAAINTTNIALMIQNPVSVSDFRPISLCNVLYKMISKVLANRLKGMLPSIIAPY